MKVERCYEKDSVVLRPEDGVKHAASKFISNKIWAAPVVDDDKKVVGIISITDMLNTFSPDFLPILGNVDYIKDYGALDISIKDVEELAKLKVSDIMSKNVITIDEDGDLVVAISLMKTHGFRTIPVVKQGKLAGMITTVDICRRFLEVWEGKTKGEG
ncbi:MAG: CBS domain-containing protein [Candidatus Brocadiales bacterium]|nr:CBS domain-containing protein [Candidatus Bathyanammoxibius sp.]